MPVRAQDPSVQAAPAATPDGGHPSYRAILRHEVLLGDDGVPAHVDPVPHARWPMIARIGAGVGASAVTTPLIVMLSETAGSRVAPVAVLSALTGVVGAYASYLITRREITTWMARLAQRTERLFRRDPGIAAAVPVDFERYLHGLADDLEIALERQIRQERDALLHTITSLASALEARDPFTRNHSAHVAKFSVRVGKQMGLGRAELYELHLAGLLHDIGKIGIPDAILLKPSALTREEYEVMKTHPGLGARILSRVPGLESVTQIVLHHHEMWNGHGYPDGIAGRDIPVGARIIAASDTYLSMVEDRPYRAAQRLDRVFQELRRVAGEQLDPDVVEALLLMIRKETETYGAPLLGNYETLGTGDAEPEQKEAA